MRKSVFIIILIICSLGLFAQSHEVNLSVISSSDSLPLTSANIYIEPCACGGFSDSNGELKLQLETGSYAITISFIGHETLNDSIEINGPISLMFFLEEKTEELASIIVNARRDEDLVKRKMGVVKLQAKALEILPAALGEFDVLRSLLLLPGVSNAGEVSNGLSIRGSSLDQNLVLYDNAPVFNPTHLFGLFSVFTPDLVGGVDLYKSYVPAVYGGRVASVTHVNTQSSLTRQTEINGGVGLVSSRLAIKTPIINDRLTLFTGARVGFTGFLLPLLSERLKDTKANFADATLKLDYLPSKKDEISFTGFYSTDFYQLDLITRIDNINSNSNQYDFETFNQTLGWRRNLNRKKNFELTLVNSIYSPKLLFPEADIDNKVVFESRIGQQSLLASLFEERNQKFSYKYGFQIQRYRLLAGMLNPGTSNNVSAVDLGEENTIEFSPFAEMEWHPVRKIELSAGIRYTYYSLFGPYTMAIYREDGTVLEEKVFSRNEAVQSYDGLEPRVGLNYEINPDFSAKASFSMANQYLQNIYNSTSPIPTSRWKASDTYIRPQRSTHWSAGVYHGFLNNEFEVGLETYYKSFQNVLTYKPGADFFLESNLEQDVVQGEGEAYGVEFSFEKTKGKTTGWLNYSWSRSFIRSSNEKIEDRINNNDWFPSDFDRPHSINAVVNFEGELYSDVSLIFTMQSGRPYSVANGAFRLDDVLVPVFLERNNARLKTYHRLDLSWKINNMDDSKKWKSYWVITIYNLYGRKNPFNKFYSQAPVTQGRFFNGPLSAYELSIINTPLLSLSYNFTIGKN